MSQIAQIAQVVRLMLQRTGLNLEENQKPAFVAVSLARAINTILPIPTSPVNSVDAHYASSFDEYVRQIIAEINENYILDVRSCRDMCAKIYRFRYNMCHDASFFMANLTEFAPAAKDMFSTDTMAIIEMERSIEDRANISRLWVDLTYEIANSLRQNTDVNGAPMPVALSIR